MVGQIGREGKGVATAQPEAALCDDQFDFPFEDVSHLFTDMLDRAISNYWALTQSQTLGWS